MFKYKTNSNPDRWVALKYKFIKSLTSDVSWEAYGKNLKEVFENSALALFNVICQVDELEVTDEVEITAKGSDAGELMINWLQELIASVDIDAVFFRRFEIKEITDTMLKAVCYGEPITKEKGETVVKAVTYHDFKFEKTDSGYMTRVVVDI
jgi:SHS2 domain-containing protein